MTQMFDSGFMLALVHGKLSVQRFDLLWRKALQIYKQASEQQASGGHVMSTINHANNDNYN